MDAQGALDSLLGRLTTVLVNEAQLLGGVRSDVEFIKDEMESMNGLILHLTEAQHRDHQVRAWMRQVVGLTRDCEGNVELYVHYVGSRPDDDGLLGYLRRIIRFLRTILVRHRIATRIQELKVRARDVGDRRQRYGVTVPASTRADMNVLDVEPSVGEEDLQRRAILLDAAETPPDADQEVRYRWVMDVRYRCDLLNSNIEIEAKDLLGEIFNLCWPNTFAMKTLLHLLYHYPNRTQDELREYRNTIYECRRLNKSISNQVLLWCYSELPSKYRSSLLYLTVFPEGYVIKTTSLARRWVAEGLVTATSNTSTTATNEIRSSTDEADHCLDVLFTRGFVCPLEISPEGNIKSCTVHHEVRDFVARVATDVNFVDSNLPPCLARYLSIHNRIGLQKSNSDGDSKDIVAYLPSLAASPQWQLLKVLDLEGCHGLEKQQLKSICRILLLKYLSLRNTDVAELPKQIKELQCLETLDIRQTKIPMLARKATVLPLLKHFLAGHKVSESNLSENPVSAVQMPICISKMNNMEILSHVRVSNNNELLGIAQLLKLRKLGVVLHGKHAKLCDLFCHIEKLQGCLRSLSIRTARLAGSETHYAGEVEALPTLPQFIKSLNISGVSNGLPCLIQDRHQLAKVTLSLVYLKEDGIRILGSLHGLRYLRLQHKSYTESELNFRADEFLSLNYILAEGSDITKISFDVGAALKLERIVWYFNTMEALSGVRHLPELKKLELNGDCNLDLIEELDEHPNHPQLKHKPLHQCQQDGNAMGASSSSAP